MNPYINSLHRHFLRVPCAISPVQQPRNWEHWPSGARIPACQACRACHSLCNNWAMQLFKLVQLAKITRRPFNLFSLFPHGTPQPVDVATRFRRFTTPELTGSQAHSSATGVPQCQIPSWSRKGFVGPWGAAKPCIVGSLSTASHPATQELNIESYIELHCDIM